MVRLNPEDEIILLEAKTYFNSTMVRLNQGAQDFSQALNMNFNSTMVRLNPITCINGNQIIFAFQFHYG